MEIEDLTLKQIRELIAQFGPSKHDKQPHPFVGRYVIARCKDAGVHAGVLVSAYGRSAILKESRRLWRWRVPMGASSFLSGVATAGIADDSKAGAPVDIALTEVCELIPCSAAAEKSIRGFAECPRTR